MRKCWGINSFTNMKIHDQIYLYEKVLQEYKQGVYYVPGLCQLFQDLWVIRKLITEHQQYFLIREVEAYRKSKGIISKFIWPKYEKLPRIKYLEEKIQELKHSSNDAR